MSFMMCLLALCFGMLSYVTAQEAGQFIDKKFTISAPGINASFINYGARLTNLFVDDKNAVSQDVALGYDDPKAYINDTNTVHTYYGRWPVWDCGDN